MTRKWHVNAAKCKQETVSSHLKLSGIVRDPLGKGMEGPNYVGSAGHAARVASLRGALRFHWHNRKRRASNLRFPHAKELLQNSDPSSRKFSPAMS
jgi:hypothetical protein